MKIRTMFSHLALLAFVVVAGAWPAAADEPQPLWTVDLAPNGLNEQDLQRLSWPRPVGVLFLSKDRVAVHFEARNVNPALSRRGELSPADPWQLHLIVFDRNGRPQQRLQTGSRIGRAVFALADGGVLLQIDNILRSLTPELKVRAEYELKDSGWWHADVPKTGDVVFLGKNAEGKKRLRVLDTRTLKVIGDSELHRLPMPFRAMETALIACEDHISAIVYGRFGGQWTTVLQEPLLTCGIWNVIGNTHYAVAAYSTNKRRTIIGEIEGTRRITIDAPPGWEVVDILSSAHEGKVGILYGKKRQDWLDVGLPIEHFQIRLHNVALTNVHPEAVLQMPKGFRAAALSPDGTKLAVIAGNKLMMFAIQ